MNVKFLEAVCATAILENGWQKQAVVALEELSEAQKEICKFLRGQGDKEHLAEELADAQIMIMQMEMAFGLTGIIGNWIDKKAQRLSDRLERGNE